MYVCMPSSVLTITLPQEIRGLLKDEPNISGLIAKLLAKHYAEQGKIINTEKAKLSELAAEIKKAGFNLTDRDISFFFENVPLSPNVPTLATSAIIEYKRHHLPDLKLSDLVKVLKIIKSFKIKPACVNSNIGS